EFQQLNAFDSRTGIGARFPVWSIVIGVVCLLAMLPVVNFMAHSLWMSGHPVEGGGEAGAAWGRRADLWFGVLVVLLGVMAWCAGRNVA
ncbi:MAG: hypothetical protein ACF8MJ_02100, partial [Phycisphaerales bacterium JB050]